ncbi:UPF0692 protein C19orf54 homolog isoform X4 [Nannospalax galili]|uniref:UPF0692 protein C19orf54 homolog isoform X4 n=1 Tax=Nannospalax galili TaxID=1026970 RepID=UPI00111C6FAE|nr:UPF0692 protein C19orf54 homolog isoform X4 [Nannospalax galili]
MASPCSFPSKPTTPPRTHTPQAPVIPPPLPPNPLDLALPSPPCSLQAPIPPPPPLPPQPSAVEVAPPRVYGLEKSRLLQEALEKAGPVPKGREDVKRLLKLHKDRFRSDLQWILFCADLPSLIQEGPQCGLVALWMAGRLLLTSGSIPLERLVQVAMERGYTAQGEMFSAADMGRLAQETLGCQTELLGGGLGGPNRDRVLQHLITGYPLLIPYDEDFNHEPCQRKGHKAHWAGSCWVYKVCQALATLKTQNCQGKSWHYQLWDYNQVRDSNLQLTDFSPLRATDGRVYVVPTGGVRAGLCGQALLLRPQE